MYKNTIPYISIKKDHIITRYKDRYYDINGEVYDVKDYRALDIYDMAISIDRTLKSWGYKRSLSKYLKDKVKEAVKFMTSFEHEIVRQGIKHNCHTVICGHIHHPDDKIINNIRYLNCGDFIENNTFIIYNNNEYTIIKG
jgi:UDP-2,3-diacylglucosamine pyrophosphatase LpxH